jgi:enoyl-CoA hydratase/carnithine racemase
MVGADTSEFFPAVTDGKEGERIACSWSATARRLHNEFDISVGFINGKRCMGGMLELMMHCHYLIAAEDATLAMPEVTLPVVPGMEGCHWSMRKATPAGRKQLMRLLLEGAQVKARNATEWLVDYAGSLEDALRMAWRVMEKGAAALPLRKVEERSMEQIPMADLNIPMSSDASIEEARRAIARCITDSCSVPLSEAILIQARHSAEFMTGKLCRKGKVGSEYDKVNQ